jgi:hypothetical protein
LEKTWMGPKWEWKEDERSDEMNTHTQKSGVATFVCRLDLAKQVLLLGPNPKELLLVVVLCSRAFHRLPWDLGPL